MLADRLSLSSGEAFARVRRGELDGLKGMNEIALGQVTYHLWVLERAGAVELTARPTRDRAASYRPTPTGRLLMLVIGADSGGSRT
jgi:hypothetical protein